MLFLSFDKCLARHPGSLPDVYLTFRSSATCSSSSLHSLPSDPNRCSTLLHQFVPSSATTGRTKRGGGSEQDGLNGPLRRATRSDGINLAARSGDRQIAKSDRGALPWSPRSGVTRVPRPVPRDAADRSPGGRCAPRATCPPATRTRCAVGPAMSTTALTAS
jgi:hypothetical protein